MLYDYRRQHKITFFVGGNMKKLLLLIIIGIAVFATAPVNADHRYNNHYGYNYNFNNGGYYKIHIDNSIGFKVDDNDKNSNANYY